MAMFNLYCRNAINSAQMMYLGFSGTFTRKPDQSSSDCRL